MKTSTAVSWNDSQNVRSLIAIYQLVKSNDLSFVLVNCCQSVFMKKRCSKKQLLKIWNWKRSLQPWLIGFKMQKKVSQDTVCKSQ